MFVSVLAVREDRMPGGRNSGALYNMCKVRTAAKGSVICVIKNTVTPPSLKNIFCANSLGKSTVVTR